MYSQEPEGLEHDTQVLEGPDISDIRSLLNLLMDVNTQVLEGPDIGDVSSLLNVLLVVTSFSLTVFVCYG